MDGSGADAAAYSQRLAKYHCAFGARIHDLTNLRQREHARDKVRGWEEDLRELSADHAARYDAICAMVTRVTEASLAGPDLRLKLIDTATGTRRTNRWKATSSAPETGR